MNAPKPQAEPLSPLRPPPVVVDAWGRARATRLLAEWSPISRHVVDDEPLLTAVVLDTFDDLVERAHYDGVQVTGPAEVAIVDDHADAWTRNLSVVLVEVWGLDEPHRVARSRWRRGRRWAADRARRVRRVFEP